MKMKRSLALTVAFLIFIIVSIPVGALGGHYNYVIDNYQGVRVACSGLASSSSATASILLTINSGESGLSPSDYTCYTAVRVERSGGWYTEHSDGTGNLSASTQMAYSSTGVVKVVLKYYVLGNIVNQKTYT